MMYDETGQFSLFINIHTSIVGVEAKMLSCHENKLYKIICYTRGEMENSWLTKFKTSLLMEFYKITEFQCVYWHGN